MRLMLYTDRGDAGLALATELKSVVRPPCVVVAIPRGGVIVAEPIAARLDCPLTLTFVRKLALPSAPELAIGALDEDGHAVVDDARVEELLASSTDLSRTRARAAAEIERQREVFPAPRLREFLPRCSVVLVDDGLATGHTMRAAVAHARRHGARHIAIAVPCASRHAADELGEEVDALVCPQVDDDFMAVGAYYRSFPPVRDDEVQAVLERARRRSVPHAG